MEPVYNLAGLLDYQGRHCPFGFRMLTWGWSDDSTFLPVNSALLSSENKKNQINEAAAVDRWTVGVPAWRGMLGEDFLCRKESMQCLNSWKLPPKCSSVTTERICPSFPPTTRIRRNGGQYLLSVLSDVVKEGKTILAKVVYVRNHNKGKVYLCLIPTDISLDENEISCNYGKRWKIMPISAYNYIMPICDPIR